MPGPPPKPTERRQRRNKRSGGKQLQLAPARALADVPAAPKNWLATTKAQWSAFWMSEIARLVDAVTQRPAVLRLYSLYDERDRAYRAFTKQRLVKGSTGQPVVNPMWRQVPIMDAEIRQLEDRFGLTPVAQLKLGITFGEAARSLEDINRQLNEDQGAEDGDEGKQDPRIRLA